MKRVLFFIALSCIIYFPSAQTSSDSTSKTDKTASKTSTVTIESAQKTEYTKDTETNKNLLF